MRMIALGSLILLSACGSQSSGKSAAPATTATAPSTASDHSMLVADASKLPPCDANAEGWLVYLKAEAKFQVCSTGAWTDVDIKGPKGDTGATGAAGAPGASGKDFTDQLTQANVALIKDQMGANVGFQVTGETAIVLYSSTVRAPITSLTAGFANQNTGYVGYCYYLNGTCTGTCYLDANLPFFVSTSSLIAPNGTKTNFSGTNSPFGSRVENGNTTCDTATGVFPTIGQQATYFQGTSISYTLPFQSMSL